MIRQRVNFLYTFVYKKTKQNSMEVHYSELAIEFVSSEPLIACISFSRQIHPVLRSYFILKLRHGFVRCSRPRNSRSPLEQYLTGGGNGGRGTTLVRHLTT
jgi:hypothetical protein